VVNDIDIFPLVVLIVNQNQDFFGFASNPFPVDDDGLVFGHRCSD